MHIWLLLWSDGVYLVTQNIKTNYSGLLLTVSIQYRISWGYCILFVNSNSLIFFSTVYDKLENGLSSDSVGMLPLHMKCTTAPPTTLFNQLPSQTLIQHKKEGRLHLTHQSTLLQF